MQDLIEKARVFAPQAHAGATRKFTGEPYITHAQALAERAAQLDGATPEMVAAAWLHDVVEDTDYTVDDMRREFGDLVASLVDELTNPSKDRKDLPRAERKALDRAHIAAVSHTARRIKLLDRIHNLSCRIDEAPRDFAETYLNETDLMLNEALVGTDTALETELRQILRTAREALRSS